MIIMSDKYPNISKAFAAIDEDNGASLYGLPVHEVPDSFGPYLDRIEKTLGSLSRTERAPEAEPLPAHVKPNPWLDSEFYTFCNGEYTEMTAMVNRDIDHTLANILLMSYFEPGTLEGDPYQEALKMRIAYYDSILDSAKAEQLRRELT